MTFANTWQTKEGFEILFKQYYEPLCNFVFGMVKDYDASEDVIQELFVKFWEKRNELPDDLSIKAYMYRAARNLALNHLRWVLIIIFFEILIPPEPFMRDAPHFFYRKYNKNLL